MNACLECRYFVPATDGYGECHCKPPVFVSNFLTRFSDDVVKDLAFMTCYPVVLEGDMSCGKFSQAHQDATA